MDIGSALSQEIIEQSTQRWDHFEGREETTLIRLAILRDLSRALHAAKSSQLSVGKRDDAGLIQKWESKVGEYRTAGSLEFPFSTLLDGTANAKKRTRLLPETLFSNIEKEKFERYDRVWESTLAGEAVSLGWCFWALDAWIKIESAEKWQTSLANLLLPHGVILFAESAPETHPPSELSSSIWQGRWYIVLNPKYKTPDFGASKLLGTSLEPTPPRWKLLFTSKKR